MIVRLVDAHRRKADFAGSKFFEPFALQSQDIGVKLQRPIDVSDVEHDMIQFGDFEYRAIADSFAGQDRVRSSLRARPSGLSTPRISLGVPTVIRRQSCKPGDVEIAHQDLAPLQLFVNRFLDSRPAFRAKTKFACDG